MQIVFSCSRNVSRSTCVNSNGYQLHVWLYARRSVGRPFAAECVSNIGSVVLNYFLSAEFQDGKRKRRQRNRQQRYLGRGSPHIHAVIWIENVTTGTFRTAVNATQRDSLKQTKCVIQASQCSYTGSGADSNRLERMGRAAWQFSTETHEPGSQGGNSRCSAKHSSAVRCRIRFDERWPRNAFTVLRGIRANIFHRRSLVIG